MRILCQRAEQGSLTAAATILSPSNQVIGKVKVRGTYKLRNLGWSRWVGLLQETQAFFSPSSHFCYHWNDAWALLRLALKSVLVFLSASFSSCMPYFLHSSHSTDWEVNVVNFRIYLPWKQPWLFIAIVNAFKIDLSFRWDALCTHLFLMCWGSFWALLHAWEFCSFSGKEENCCRFVVVLSCQTVA